MQSGPLGARTESRMGLNGACNSCFLPRLGLVWAGIYNSTHPRCGCVPAQVGPARLRHGARAARAGGRGAAAAAAGGAGRGGGADHRVRAGACVCVHACARVRAFLSVCWYAWRPLAWRPRRWVHKARGPAVHGSTKQPQQGPGQSCMVCTYGVPAQARTNRVEEIRNLESKLVSRIPLGSGVPNQA